MDEIGDLIDLQKGQIMGACLGASVTLTAQLFGVLRAVVFKFLTVYKKRVKTSSAKKNNWQKPMGKKLGEGK